MHQYCLRLTISRIRSAPKKRQSEGQPSATKSAWNPSSSPHENRSRVIRVKPGQTHHQAAWSYGLPRHLSQQRTGQSILSIYCNSCFSGCQSPCSVMRTVQSPATTWPPCLAMAQIPTVSGIAGKPQACRTLSAHGQLLALQECCL